MSSNNVSWIEHIINIIIILIGGIFLMWILNTMF